MTFLNDLLKKLGVQGTIDQVANRAMRAALLDKELFREVEEDSSLNQEALMIVIVASVGSGIAAFITSIFRQQIGKAVLGLIIPSAVGIANYFIWAYVTQFIALNMYESDTDIGELLRVLGYATTPRLLSLLGFIPCLGPVLSFAGGIWALVAGFIGIREALDLDTTDTIVTVILGWLAIMIISGIVTTVLGIGAIGLGPVLHNLGLY